MSRLAHRPRVAIVVQRYGADIAGGAERAAQRLAEELTAVADVAAITTCAREYTTWANVYEPGQSELNGVSVHRFAVDYPRNWKRSQRETGRFFQEEHSIDEQLEWVKQQGPMSTELVNYVARSADLFDVFIFVTYVYATTVLALPAVAQKAILVPAAHDEPALYLDLFRDFFQKPQLIACFTAAEQQLIQQVMGRGLRSEPALQTPTLLTGLGVDLPPDDISAARFRSKYDLYDRFMLYVGRVAAGKNVPELFDHFTKYKERNPGPLKLLLIGQPTVEIPDHRDIVSLGFLPEADKFDAYAAAEWVVMPSRYESLSIIALEAWLMQRPMLVNGECEVLKEQCRRSQAGLYYTSFVEFEALVKRFESDLALRQKMGALGQAFVWQNYRWPIVVAKYQGLFDYIMRPGS